MKFTFNHLEFRSEDPDAAAKFYCNHFGATIKSETLFSMTKSFQLELNGEPLMTISGRAEGEDPVPGSTEPRYGMDHFGFEVDDINAAIAHFRAEGVHISCEPWTTPVGSIVAFVEAPDHVSVELMQSPAA